MMGGEGGEAEATAPPRSEHPEHPQQFSKIQP